MIRQYHMRRRQSVRRRRDCRRRGDQFAASGRTVAEELGQPHPGVDLIGLAAVRIAAT